MLIQPDLPPVDAREERRGKLGIGLEGVFLMIRELGMKKPKIDESAFVSEAAYVVGDVEIGENSSIWPGAVLRADRFRIRIGANSNIQDNCVVHAGFSDMTIGN